MTTRAEVLFEAVLADRRSDAARLAYADAIAAHQPEHAEFIRVQVELAAAAELDPSAREFQRRSMRLEMQVRGGLQRAVRPPAKAVTIRRGFVEGVLIDARLFLAHAERLVSSAPILDLALLDAAPVIEAVCARAELDGMRSLKIRGGIGDAGALAVARSPHLGALRWLDLARNEIGEEGLEALASSENLPSLAHLVFHGNPAPDPTPQIVEEGGFIHFFTYPEAGRGLMARHGHRQWLGDEPVGIPRVEHF